MLGYGVSIGDSISEIEEEQRKKKPLPPISEMADLLLAADGHAVPSAPGNPGSGTSSPLPPISEAADKILSGTAQDASVNSKQLPPISEAADMLLAGVPSAPASVPAIDRSEHGNNMALNLNVPDAAKDPLHIGAAAQNAYWNLQESKGNTQAMRAFQLEQAKRENSPGEVVAVNRSGVAPMTPVEEAVMLRQMAAKDRGDTEQASGLEKSFDYRVDELKDEAKRLWESAEKGRVKYDLPDNKFGAAILQTIESSGMTVEAALRSGALWALGGPALGLMGSFINTATEADYEAGEAFMTALKAGKSPEEIQDAVNSVRKKNLALLSLTNPLGDVLLFGLGKPLKALAGKIAGKGLLAKAGRAVVERGVPYVLGAAPEGVEGGSQEAFQQQAAGQDLDWEKIKEAAGSEALASLLYGLVGRGIRGGAKVLLGSQADSDGGKPGEPPAPPPGSGETSQTDGKPLSPQERVRSKLLELREKIFSSYLGPDPRYKGAAPALNWDNMSAAMKKQVVRLRKAMELWDEGKYDESERLASLLKDEMMPEKDTPLWAPVEETAETAEPSMPISEAADQVLADTSIPASDTSGNATDTSTPMERVKGKIRGQLEAIAAQGGEQAQVLGSEEIDAYSTLFAAMAEQAGNRQGISAEEWLQSQNLKIVNGRPQFEASSEGTKLDQPLNEGVDPESTMTGFVAQPRFTAEQALELRSGKRRVEFIRSVSGKYQNEDTGWNINLSNKNVSHAIASAVKNNEVDLATSMNILAELPKIIQNARLVESHEDQKQKGYVDKIHRFFVPSKISNDPKAMYKVKLTVKELAGHFETSIEGIYRAYDTRIIEKVSERRHRKGLKDQPLNSHTPDTFEIILGPFLEGVKDSKGNPYIEAGNSPDLKQNVGDSSEQGPVADEATTRGSTLFGKGRVTITLGKAMDRTTLVHEFGHLFLADLFKQAKNGVASAIRDLNVLMSWWTQEASWLAKWISANKYGTFTAEQAARFAGKDGAQLVRDALAGKADPDTAQVVFVAGHEMFARGFERYLSDGTAPNGQLKAVFERFKTWMAEVYGRLAGDPNFKLSKDAREVMDRMVGGENAAQAGAAENVSVARNGNETTVTLNESQEDSSGREFFQKVKKKRPGEGSIPPGQEPARQTQIRPATGQALFKKSTLDSTASQKEYTGGAALDLKTAVERGHISREEADFMEAMIGAFPKAFSDRFEVQLSPDKHPGGTSAYSVHKMGGTLEDAKHVVTLFKGGNVIDAIHGFGRFIHDRALTGADVRIVKSTWQKADTKADRAEWFADQFTSWWIDGQTQNSGMASIFRKMMKALKGLVDKFRGKNVLRPDMEALLNDIVTNGREISEKYFFNDADFVRKYLLGVDPDPNDWLGEGFSDNSKTFTSWDPGNLCPKKDSFIEYIVARMKKEGKTYADLVNVDLIARWYDEALKEGIQVPCSYCYVEQARRKAIQFQQQGKSIAGVRFAMAKTSIRSIPYKGALLNTNRFSDKKIKEMNKRGGLRMFSFSDYIRAVHRVQIGKMLRDAAKRLLSVKAITKVAEFVEDFASTGITINQSLDAMNPMFGMDWDLAVQNKEKYPNVKIRVVARNLQEFDRFWKLKYRVKPDGSIEYLDAWKTRKQDRTDQSGLPTKPAKDYEKRLAEDGWKEMVDVITPYHHDDYTSPVPKGYEDLVWDGKSMRELRRQNPDIVNRTCCQEGGKCYNAKTGEQCQCNCGLGAGNLSIPHAVPEALNEIQLNQGARDEKTPPNKKGQQQALTHKAEETEQARRMNNAPETPWPDEGSPISEQDIEEVFGTRSRAVKETETPWPGEGENVTEADIDEIFSEGSWSVEGFSSAVQAIDDFFAPEKKRGGGEKGPNTPKNRERYDKVGNLLSENTKEVSYLNPIYTLTSPSLLAKKNKLFAPFFKIAKEAQELQETLRRDFNAVLDKAWGNLSDDQSQALNEILIEGDLRGRTFTDEQLTARGLDEDVRRSYSLIRDLSDRVGKAVRQRQRDSGTKVMGWREGYVPHIFHGFFIRLDGRIVDTARSLHEAVELARNVEKDHPGGTVDITSKPNDFSGSSAYNASALNDRKLLKFSTTMEEAFAFTPDEAERFLKGYDKKAFKNRIFAFSHERLGVKGWDQDMKFAFRHYVNQSARFLAMDELKYKGIGLFEKMWGNFNHEYSQLADYTKKYLNDVLGVPSNASRMMNDLFKRNPTMYKISKQVFGDRPAEYLASVFTKGMGVAKLGFLNIASAMMNLSQLINASALLGYSDLGLGIRQYFANLTKPSERVTRIYEETGVLDNLNVAAGAGYSKASEKMYGIVGRFLELSMAPFAYMDGMCRKATVLAAYNKAHREGKSHTEAIAYAKEINDRANFDYSVADTPAFLRRSGPLGQVIFQFKKFGIKQLELATGLNGFAQNARFWIPMIALSGLWGFPGAELLRALFMALFDRDPQAELNVWMAKEDWISEPVRRTIQYGALSNAGVDISKRVGMGDVIPNELADLLGPTVGTIHRMAPHVATLAGKLFGLEGDGTAALLNALEALSPGLSNPIKAILGEVEDKTRGRLKFRYQGSGERAVRAMGFRPTREAVESDAVRTANYVEAKRMEREREAIDEYVRARESGSTKDAAKALARMKELKVTPDRIIRELRERKKGTAYERLQQKLKGQKSQEARKVLQGF